MKASRYLIIFLLLLLTVSCQKEKETRIIDFVDPFLQVAGSEWHFPRAVVPFGSIRLGPDYVNTSGQNNNQNDILIASFSPAHRDINLETANLHFLPTTKTLQPGESLEVFVLSCLASFSRHQETAEPGFYSVVFNNGIKAELAVTERCGMLYYEFPDNATYGMTLNLGGKEDETGETSIKKVNNRTLNGYKKFSCGGNSQRVYFQIEFSQDVNVWAGNDTARLLTKGERTTSKKSYAWIDFGKTTNKIVMKISTSSANTEGAAANLSKEMPHWSFDKVKRDARQQWRRVLSRIKIPTDHPETARKFYTALYHNYLTPFIYSDVHGNFKGCDGEIHSVGKNTQYAGFFLNDAHRLAYSLLAITQRERVSDIIRSLLNHYDYTGEFPRERIGINGGDEGTSRAAISLITEAYLKGIRGYDVEKAYEAVNATATPLLSMTDSLTDSRATEYGYDTWCMAQLAKVLDKENDYLSFLNASRNFKNRSLSDPKETYYTTESTAAFVFHALGLFPTFPGECKYRLNCPLFDKIIIKLGQDRRFVIKTSRENANDTYIKEIILNGKTLDHSWITHEEIIRGGELEFILSPTPENPTCEKH